MKSFLASVVYSAFHNDYLIFENTNRVIILIHLSWKLWWGSSRNKQLYYITLTQEKVVRTHDSFHHIKPNIHIRVISDDSHWSLADVREGRWHSSKYWTLAGLVFMQWIIKPVIWCHRQRSPHYWIVQTSKLEASMLG